MNECIYLEHLGHETGEYGCESFTILCLSLPLQRTFSDAMDHMRFHFC